MMAMFLNGEALNEGGPTQDIAALVVNSDNLTVLELAVIEAGLVETLQGNGPFTVFAPTDAAFNAYLEEVGLTAQELLDSDDLADILTYHVYEGEVQAAAAITLASSNNNVITM